jgi:hypothetical protein
MINGGFGANVRRHDELSNIHRASSVINFSIGPYLNP